MIGENIRRARKARGLSQEEMAVKLNVVRQTVSKWENGLSVPDADVLVRMAQLLDTPVTELLGVGLEEDTPSERDLAAQLARLNEELAARAQRERLAQRAGQKRGLILLLCLLSLPAAMACRNETVNLLLFAGCVLAALAVFYRNLTLLTGPSASSAQLRAVRAVTIFNFVLLGALLTLTALLQSGRVTLTEEQARPAAMVFVVVMMLFYGFAAPRLPFNRHTGLRLPWTVRDEDTWNAAHRMLGGLTLPAVALYLAACRTLDQFWLATACALLLWAGIPGALSLVFFWKKTHGKL